MPDTLGEDRLLDEVEEALRDWNTNRAPTGRQVHDWLARLCARVRHLEAQVEHEHANATAILRKYEGAIADADRAELASQRLTEALRPFAKYGMLSDGKDGAKGAEVGDDLVVLQERAGPFTATLTVGDFRRAGEALGTGAPPDAGQTPERP